MPPDNETPSLKVTVTLIVSFSLYVPSLVVDVTDVIVGAVVSITKALVAAKFEPMVKLDIALPTASESVPALNAIPDTVRSDDVSPDCTVYVPDAVLDDVIVSIVTVRSVSPVSNVTTKFPPSKVTASLKVTVTLTVSFSLYVPSSVVDVTDVIVGAVVSITKALVAAKFEPMVKLDIALPTASESVPALNAIPDTVRSDDVSPDCTVYVPDAVLDDVIVSIVTVRSVSPVSNVTTKFPPAKVTASLKVSVTLIVSSALYVPSLVVDVTDVIVGAVPS